MRKLYEKSEIGFALVWIGAYGLLSGNLRRLGEDSPYLTLGLLAVSAGMLLFVKENGLAEKYGLAAWPRKTGRFLWFLPLWMIAAGNLWGGLQPQYRGAGLAWAAASLALVGFAEELLFRGFLFRALWKALGGKTAVIVSALIFGLCHLVNLFSGQSGPETAVQAAFAVAMGFVFALTFYKSGSLLPGAAAHSLLDVASLFSQRSPAADAVYVAAALAVSAAYSLWLARQKVDIT